MNLTYAYGVKRPQGVDLVMVRVVDDFGAAGTRVARRMKQIRLEWCCVGRRLVGTVQYSRER